MELIVNPSVAYIIVMISFFLLILALLTPGTGLLELVAGLGVILSIVTMFYNPIRGWLLIPISFSILLLILSIYKSKRWWLMVLALLLFFLCSLFLFRVEGRAVSVNPWLAFLLTVIEFLLLWWIGRKTFDAFRQQPDFDLAQLIGAEGTARSDIYQEGTVYVNGEEWSAHSEKPINTGSRIKVVNRDGLQLRVEEIEPLQIS